MEAGVTDKQDRPTLEVGCKNCGQLILATISSEDLRSLDAARGGPVREKCPHCGQAFDYWPYEYMELPPS